MVEMYQQEIFLSGSGDNFFDQEIYVKGDFINTGSGDLQLDSGVIEGNFKNTGTGDISSQGTIIIGGDLILQGTGDIDGNFIILGKMIKAGSGDVFGKISASGYNISGVGDFNAKRAPLTAEAAEKIRNSFGVLSNLNAREQDKASELIERNLNQSFEQIIKKGITINIYGDYVENGGMKTGNIQGEYVDIVGGSATKNTNYYQNAAVQNNCVKQNGELVAIDIAKSLNELRAHCTNNEEVFSICLTMEVLTKKFNDESVLKNIAIINKRLSAMYDDFDKPNEDDKKRIIGLCKYIEEVYSSKLIHGNPEALQKNE